MEIGAFACNRSTSEAASSVKRISSSPGVIWESMSARGKSSALIRENSGQIAIIKSRMVIDKTLQCFIMAIGCQRSAISGRFSALSVSRSGANLSDSADFLLAISCQSSLIDFQTTLCQSQRFGMPVFFAERRWFPTTDSQFSISQHHRSQPSLLSAEKTSLCINLSWYVKTVLAPNILT